jgi:hypothetical protein
MLSAKNLGKRKEKTMSKDKQIEEMANIISSKINGANFDDVSDAVVALYDAGYRKQSEGEWEYEQLDNFRKYKVTCPFCKSYYIGNYDAYDDPEYFNFCPECGAKMKGE